MGEAVGMPPLDEKHPSICDYVDWPSRHRSVRQEDLERRCIADSRAVTCVSQPLVDRARVWNAKSYLIPNGADIQKFRNAKGDMVKKRYHLTESKVVSLIGLTSSPSNYFIKAVQLAKKYEPRLKCLLVGRSERIENDVRKVDPAGETFIITGPIGYSEIEGFFAATDVGLYPGDETNFFRWASPIKVIEYSACGKQVVASSVIELQRLGWPNIQFRPATAEDFCDGILTALNRQTAPIDDEALREFDWKTLAERFERVLQEVASA
jgi:glycosyltransferase involved in cell wall biosynthesis